MAKTRKTSTRRKTSKKRTYKRRKKSTTKRNARLSLIVSIIALLIVFSHAFLTSECETFSAKFKEAFAETVRTLNITATDYNEVGIVSEDLKLDKIQEGYPKISARYNEVETYAGFHLSYNEQHEQANWVAYILTKKMVRNDKVDRTDNFRSDDNIRTESAALNDYRGSGYDRGHLAPAADMHWSVQTMEESFLMSNMSPQEQDFNRGVWKDLEEQLRDFAVENERIFVVTGPIFKSVKKKIGSNKVSVPKYYYKVVLDISPPAFKGVAFLLENRQSDKPLESFAMSIDELEKFSGIDFFYHVKDPALQKIEATYNVNDWNF